MGNLSIRQDLFRYNRDHWQPLTQSTSQQLMINQSKGIIGQVQTISEIHQKYINSLQLRARNHNYLVDVFAIFKGHTLNTLPNPTPYCTNLNKSCPIKVLIENIHYRLPDLGTINYHQAIYILYQSLSGIKAISQEHLSIGSSFQEQMIGFNQQGQCKIWLNTNFFKEIDQNQSELSNPQKLAYYKQFITQLMESIQGRMSCQLTKQQQQQYYKIKQLYTKQIQYSNQLLYINNILSFVKFIGQRNSLHFQEFKMTIMQANFSNSSNQYPTLNQNYYVINNYIPYSQKINAKNKISLKHKNMQEKLSNLYPYELTKSNHQLARRPNKTTLNLSMQILPPQPNTNSHLIEPKNINQMFNCQRMVTPTALKKKKFRKKISRSTLITKDSECSIISKYPQSPHKVTIAVNAPKKLVPQ